MKQLQKIISDPSISLASFVERTWNCLYSCEGAIPKDNHNALLFSYDQAIVAISSEPKSSFVKLLAKANIPASGPLGPHYFEGSKLIEFNLHSAFWQSARSRLSRLSFIDGFEITNDDLDCANVRADLKIIDHKKSLIFVRRPIHLLGKAYKIDNIPDAQWFRNYRKYQYQIFQELPAVCWRHIAIAQPQHHGLIANMVSVMQSYMEMRGIDPSRQPKEDALRQMASRIFTQYVQNDQSSSVLVSTVPKDPK